MKCTTVQLCSKCVKSFIAKIGMGMTLIYFLQIVKFFVCTFAIFEYRIWIHLKYIQVFVSPVRNNNEAA